MPIQFCNAESLIQVARNWGEVLVTDPCIHGGRDVSKGKVCIQTEEMKFIQESIVISCDDHEFSIWIKETSDSVFSSPTKEKDDLEDGEIWEEDDENLGNSDSDDDEDSSSEINSDEAFEESSNKCTTGISETEANNNNYRSADRESKEETIIDDSYKVNESQEQPEAQLDLDPIEAQSSTGAQTLPVSPKTPKTNTQVNVQEDRSDKEINGDKISHKHTDKSHNQSPEPEIFKFISPKLRKLLSSRKNSHQQEHSGENQEKEIEYTPHE
ncbi:hypothetical protein LXL04_023315 [Taraxacum kok-saghyz]